jgi:phage/plasmid-like protein (TIGR03299 family)
MAHEIEIVDGVAQMAYAGEVPWHGLGKEVPVDLTPEQMLEAAGLDWGVEKVDAYIEYKGSRIATGQKALVRDRDGKILTNVGPNWEPVQNAEAFGFFHDFVMEGDMEMHTAGSLKGGEIVWALARVKESFELFGGDRVDSYLLFSNPHQYGKSIDVRFTPIRVVCNNTLTFSLETASKNSVSVSHRTKFDADEVKAMLGIASNKLSTYKETAEFLGSKRFTADSLNEYFQRVFPVSARGEAKKEVSRNAQTAMAIMDSQPGAEYGEGTWWQPFNAVTYMTDHLLSRNAETRMRNAWFGHVRAQKIKALETAVEMAEAA